MNERELNNLVDDRSNTIAEIEKKRKLDLPRKLYCEKLQRQIRHD